MRKVSFGIIWFGLLCSFWLPSVQGAGEYIINKEYDAILVRCAIAFLVLAIIFLILLIITTVYVYRRIDEDRTVHKTYQVSYRDRERVDDISNPFYGHSIYSRRTTNSIYLPGFTSATVIGTDGKPVKNAAYENEAAVMDVEGKRGSPPTEKGQKDTMVSEKMAKLDSSFENSAYELGERSVEYTARPSRPSRYTTTTISTSKQQ